VSISLENLHWSPPPPGAPAGLSFRLGDDDGRQYFAYQYPHIALAATVVLYDTARRAVLLIERENAPFGGCWAFPGGFLEVGIETAEQTAARELFEETGVSIAPDCLTLIDIRTAPDRDPRDHIADVGYYAEIHDAKAHAGDETRLVRWVPLEEVERLPLAFDHATLWRNARQRIPSLAT
jgi:8-oxo-dGTP diphosphatase